MHIVVAMRPLLIDRFFDEAARARLRSLGDVAFIDSWNDLHSSEAAVKLRDAEVLITGWGSGYVDGRVLDSAPELRAIIHSAGSVKHHVSPVCYTRGILVSSQADINARPVAEYTVASILMAGKDAFRASRIYRKRRGAVDQVVELSSAGNYRRSVGIIGASKIGRRVIELLAPFDFDVAVYDPYLSEMDAAQLNVRLTSLPDLFATSSIVSMHAPVNEETRSMVSSELLRLLPDGATVINTARGALIDQDAFIRELQSGRIGAVLDVTEPEVSEPESPLWDLENVFLTPHIAGAVGNELHRLGNGTLDEVERLITSGYLEREITWESYEQLA